MGGGLAVADGDQVLATLALPVAGLMSEAPISEVRADYDALVAAAQQLGSTMHDPFHGDELHGAGSDPVSQADRRGLG